MSEGVWAVRQNLNRATRLGLLAGILTISLLVVASAAMASGSANPFRGSYRGIDTPFDNSNMLLTFGGPDASSDNGPSDIRRVIWLDEAATSCDGDRFFAEGVGFVEGDTILVVFEIYCGNAAGLIGQDVVEFTYEPATGTLTDSYGVVWNRP
jgi:hypothetical protein